MLQISQNAECRFADCRGTLTTTKAFNVDVWPLGARVFDALLRLHPEGHVVCRHHHGCHLQRRVRGRQTNLAFEK